MTPARGNTLTAASLAGPATIYVGIGILLPLAILFRYSLNAFVPGKFMVDALTVENYVKFFTDIYYYSVLTRTVRIALITTAICLVLGFPLAYVLARTQVRFKNLLIMLVVLPLFVGNAVRAAGWMVAFGNKGLINQALSALHLPTLKLVHNETGVVISVVHFILPFFVLTLLGALKNIPQSLEDAARKVGA